MCHVAIIKTLVNGEIITDVKIFDNINVNEYYKCLYNAIAIVYKANNLH